MVNQVKNGKNYKKKKVKTINIIAVKSAEIHP